MNDKICKLIDIAFKIIPINKKQIILYSCLNQYNDNPKYIAEKLHQLDHSIQLVWATGNLQKEGDIPSYIKKVEYGSLKYFYQKARSAIIIDNGYGIASGYATGLKLKLNMLRKKKNQINVSTWHGTPLKYIGADDHELSKIYKNEDFYSLSDVLVLGSEYEANILKKITNNLIPVLQYGNPRNDVLFDKSKETKDKLKQKLGLPTDKNIVLYAPTYREDIQFAGINQMKELDIPKLCTALSDKFGGEWAFALRFHQIALQKLQRQSGFSFNDKILDGHKSADMSEYLLACDVLITDFSGSLFDVAYLNKPCFLYALDYLDYKRQRGMYINLENLPYSFAHSSVKLCENILVFDEKAYNNKVKDFLKYLNNRNEGDASLKTASYMLEYLRRD